LFLIRILPGIRIEQKPSLRVVPVIVEHFEPGRERALPLRLPEVVVVVVIPGRRVVLREVRRVDEFRVRQVHFILLVMVRLKRNASDLPGRLRGLAVVNFDYLRLDFDVEVPRNVVFLRGRYLHLFFQENLLEALLVMRGPLAVSDDRRDVLQLAGVV
jgi:hypothetical protein